MVPFENLLIVPLVANHSKFDIIGGNVGTNGTFDRS